VEPSIFLSIIQERDGCDIVLFGIWDIKILSEQQPALKLQELQWDVEGSWNKCVIMVARFSRVSPPPVHPPSATMMDTRAPPRAAIKSPARQGMPPE